MNSKFLKFDMYGILISYPSYYSGLTYLAPINTVKEPGTFQSTV